MPSQSPILWVVATPIGNLGDLSDRAREILSVVDVILAEDTRKTGRLLQLCGVRGPRLLSFFEHNEAARIKQVLNLLRQGKQIALVSSAGTPLMSDPGYILVRTCRDSGFRVSPVPGPSAPVAALMASGLPPYPFAFLGFLPRKSGEKRRLLAHFAPVQITLVFFERVSRLQRSLHDAREVLGQRQVCIARELTKKHEEFIFFSLGSDQELPADLLGEVTVLLAPQDKELQATAEEEVVRIMHKKAGPNDGARTVVNRTAPHVRGWGKKALYEVFLREIRQIGNGQEDL
ncbi:MAG: 16S rRNA (cytidine(1402)-2'-O)-methyltransferase [Desulfovermiculus sp.]